MAKHRDPLALPEWQALHREAHLVSQLIGAGATALGRASYGNSFGEYYTAFFALSIGMERLGKLIIVADYSIEHRGMLPSQAVLRRYGHKLKDLINQVHQIAEKRQLKLQFPRPDNQICGAIVRCLDAFADASQGRYANFEAIGNSNFKAGDEPIRKWWAEVVELILAGHYRGTPREAKVQHQAAEVIGASAFVRFLDEEGGVMSDVASASERTGQSQYAQSYGRFYTLSIVRWLSEVFRGVVHQAAGIDALFGHDEFFNTYRNDDSVLLTRKHWPLR
jgi:hypothetical protein